MRPDIDPDLPGFRLAIQGQYDALYGALDPAAARARHEAAQAYTARVVDALALPDEGYHLDLGCGDGMLSLAIARLRPRMTVVGVDAAPHAVALARALAEDAGLKNAAFVEGDAEAPPEGQFERLSAASLFNLLSDKRAAMRAWRERALPDARLVITDAFATGGTATDGAGPTTSDGFAQLARATRWKIVHREDLTALVTKLHAARAWPWPEYVRAGFRYALVVLSPA